jgi:hypothetical protein
MKWFEYVRVLLRVLRVRYGSDRDAARVVDLGLTVGVEAMQALVNGRITATEGELTMLAIRRATYEVEGLIKKREAETSRDVH